MDERIYSENELILRDLEIKAVYVRRKMKEEETKGNQATELLYKLRQL